MVEVEYAKALYELVDSDTQEEYYTLFKTVCNSFKEEPDFLKLFKSVTITKKEKKDIIAKVYKDFDETFLNFLYVLVDNDRLYLIDTIYHEYKKLLREKNSLVVARVSSAKPLTKSEIAKITAMLMDKYKNKEIKIKNIVDSNLIGGIQIVAMGESIDMTLKSSLDNLRESL